MKYQTLHSLGVRGAEKGYFKAWQSKQTTLYVVVLGVGGGGYFFKLHFKMIVASNADKAAKLCSLHSHHHVSHITVSFCLCNHTVKC